MSRRHSIVEVRDRQTLKRIPTRIRKCGETTNSIQHPLLHFRSVVRADISATCPARGLDRSILQFNVRYSIFRSFTILLKVIMMTITTIQCVGGTKMYCMSVREWCLEIILLDLSPHFDLYYSKSTGLIPALRAFIRYQKLLCSNSSH